MSLKRAIELLFLLILSCVVLFSSSVLLSAFSTLSILTLLILCLFIALTLYRPFWVLLVIAGTLPFFGDRPGSWQQYYQLIFIASFLLTLTLKKLFQKKSFFSAECRQNPVIVGGAFFVLSAAISLFCIPKEELESFITSFFPFFHLEFLDLFPVFWRKILRLSEEQVAYSFTATFWTATSWLLLVVTYQELKDSLQRRKVFALTLLLGLVFALFIGLLDYFKIISLLPLRQLDPVVNAKGLQFRMQSLFAHSGWFAEFLTFNIPFVLSLFLLIKKRSLAIAVIIGILVLGEVCLVLTYQRGGWLAYPITLFVVWLAVYFFEADQDSKKKNLRKKLLQLLVSIPLTIAVSVLLVGLIFKTGLLSSDYRPNFEQYEKRFKDIAKTKDRTQFFEAAFKLAELSPVFGNGTESFSWMYEREFDSPNGHYYKEIVLPLHGSAHNVFYQVLSSQGFYGLAVLLLLVFSGIYYGFFIAFKANNNYAHRLLALAAACALISFLIYGNVQEFFYVQTLQVNFFLILGLLASFISKDNFSKTNFANIYLRLSLLAILAQLFWIASNNWQRPVAAQFSKSYGCLPVKKDKIGRRVRDCGPRSKVNLPLDEQFELLSLVPTTAEIILKVSCENNKPREFVLSNKKPVSFNIQKIFDFEKCRQGERLWLRFESSDFHLKRVANGSKKYRLQPFAFKIITLSDKQAEVSLE